MTCTVSGGALNSTRSLNAKLVGGVAQQLGCQSLAGRLYLTCAKSLRLWLTDDHFVGKLSTMGQPTRKTQPSIPPGPVNEY